MPIAIPGVIVRRESLQAGDGRSNSGIPATGVFPSNARCAGARRILSLSL